MDTQSAKIAKRSRAYIKTLNPNSDRQQYEQGIIDSADGECAFVRWTYPWERLTEGELSQHLIINLDLA